MSENKNRIVRHFEVPVPAALIIMLMTPAVLCGFIYIHRGSYTGMLRNSVTGLLLAGVLLYVYNSEMSEKKMAFDNRYHPYRFVTAYTISLILAGTSALFPELIFPVAALCLMTAVLSGYATGIVSCVILSAAPLFVSGGSFEYFIFYFITGIVFITLVLEDNKKFAIIRPIMIFPLIYITSYTALIILKRMNITPAVIIDPLVGLITDLVLAAAFLIIAEHRIVFRYKDKYIEMVDPEYELLMRLKNENRPEYKRAIHCAYLCDRIADKMELNRILLKGAGFYHRIGVISDKDGSIEDNSVHMLEENLFPPQLTALVREYGNPDRKAVSVEASVLMISDRVIDTIMKTASSDTINYDEVIDKVYSSYVLNGILKNTMMSYHDMNRLIGYMKEEKLYYDFLR